ncbi:MAG: hypothetical protein KGQ47_15855, partial [Hyphomicrobiales bacterium]|nr:hypothetical protein [Hyphomicrobiales bacterium]
ENRRPLFRIMPDYLRSMICSENRRPLFRIMPDYLRSMICSENRRPLFRIMPDYLSEHDLFGKPAATFPDHA